jgi:hypothetical protein
MCDDIKYLRVKVPADLNCSGCDEQRVVQVDGCITSLIGALQNAGINMRGSCCGHGRREGYIHLQDGRILLVLSQSQAQWYFGEGIPLLGK